MKESMDLGVNRTGIATNPDDAKEMIKAASECTQPPPGDETALSALRMSYITTSSVVGTMPPPASPKGVIQTVLSALKGSQPEVFLDKLGERLAFERSGVRLYDALLAKHDAQGSYDGGPDRETLLEFQNDELEHFQLLRKTLENLGGDTTAVTPSANLVGVEASGILQVITDPRTSLEQSLHAILVAELADSEGWDMLIELATLLGQDAAAEEFREAARNEEKHLGYVRQWVVNFAKKQVEEKVPEAA